MPRKFPSRRLRIDEEIARSIERRMVAMLRREELSQFVEWVMDLYCRGYLKETEHYKQEIEQQTEDEFTAVVDEHIKKRTVPSKKVHRVGGAKGVIEDDEGKRKAS